jgi:hypothetical protein
MEEGTAQQTKSSATMLREPLLGPQAWTEVAPQWVQFSGQDEALENESSSRLEDAMRSWYDTQYGLLNDDQDAVEQGNGDDDFAMPHSERPCLPWYRNPLQIMAMMSNFSTSYNVVNISLVLPILKQILENSNPVSAEDEVSFLCSFVSYTDVCRV